MVTTTNRLSKAEVEQHVFAGLAFVLEEAAPKAFESDANLVKMLGLQSEDGADLACYLSKALGVEISHKTNLLCEDRAGQHYRLRTVGDLVGFMIELTGAAEKP